MSQEENFMAAFDRKVMDHDIQGRLARDTSEYIQVLFVPIKSQKTGQIRLDSNRFITVQRIIYTNSRTTADPLKPEQFQVQEIKPSPPLDEQKESFGGAWICSITIDGKEQQLPFNSLIFNKEPGTLVGSGNTQDDAFICNGIIKNDFFVSFKLVFGTTRTVTCQGEASDNFQTLIIKGTCVDDNSKQPGTFQFTLDKNLQETLWRQGRQNCAEVQSTQDQSSLKQKVFLIITAWNIQDDAIHHQQQPIVVNNPWPGDKPLHLSSWKNETNVSIFELNDQDQLVLKVIDLMNLEVLQTWVLKQEIRELIDDPTLEAYEGSNIKLQRSALLNTCLVTCRFDPQPSSAIKCHGDEGGAILYLNLLPSGFIQYDLTTEEYTILEHENCLFIDTTDDKTLDPLDSKKQQGLVRGFMRKYNFSPLPHVQEQELARMIFGIFNDEIPTFKEDMNKEVYEESLKYKQSSRFTVSQCENTQKFDLFKVQNFQEMHFKVQTCLAFQGDLTQIDRIELNGTQLQLYINGCMYSTTLDGGWLKELHSATNTFYWSDLVFEYSGIEKNAWSKSDVNFYERKATGEKGEFKAKIELSSMQKIQAAQLSDDGSVRVIAVTNDKHSFSIFSAKEGKATQEYSLSKLRQLEVSLPFVFMNHVVDKKKIVIINCHNPLTKFELNLHPYTLVCILYSFKKVFEKIYVLAKTQEGQQYSIVQIDAASSKDFKVNVAKRPSPSFGIANIQQVISATYLPISKTLVLLYPTKVVAINPTQKRFEKLLIIEANCAVSYATEEDIIYFVGYEFQKNMKIFKLEINEVWPPTVESVFTQTDDSIPLQLSLMTPSCGKTDFYLLQRDQLELEELQLVQIHGKKGEKEVTHLGINPEIEEHLKNIKSFFVIKNWILLNNRTFQVDNLRSSQNIYSGHKACLDVCPLTMQLLCEKKEDDVNYFVFRPQPDTKKVILNMKSSAIDDIFFLTLNREEYVLVQYHNYDDDSYTLILLKLSGQTTQYQGQILQELNQKVYLQSGQFLLQQDANQNTYHRCQVKLANNSLEKDQDDPLSKNVDQEKSLLNETLEKTGLLLQQDQNTNRICEADAKMKTSMKSVIKFVDNWLEKDEDFQLPQIDQAKTWQDCSLNKKGEITLVQLQFSGEYGFSCVEQSVIGQKYRSFKIQTNQSYDAGSTVIQKPTLKEQQDGWIALLYQDKIMFFDKKKPGNLQFVALLNLQTITNLSIDNTRYRNCLAININQQNGLKKKQHLILWDLQDNVQKLQVNNYQYKQFLSDCLVPERSSQNMLLEKSSWSFNYVTQSQNDVISVNLQNTPLDWKIVQQIFDDKTFTEEHIKLCTVSIDGINLFQLAIKYDKTDLIRQIQKIVDELQEEDKRLDDISAMVCQRGADGQSSLSLAFSKKNTRAFDSLLNIALRSSSTFISRSFLEHLPALLKQPSETFIKFLNSCTTYSVQANFGQMKMVDEDQFFLNNCTLLNSKQRPGGIYFEAPQVNPLLQSLQFAKTGSLLDKKHLDRSSCFKDNKGCCYRKKKSTQIIDASSELKDVQVQKIPQPQREQKEKVRKWVEVNILDFDWLLNDQNGSSFIRNLSHVDNTDIFECKQIQLAIKLLWQAYKSKIMWCFFFQFLHYLLCVNIYFIFIVGSMKVDDNWQIFSNVIEGIIYFDSIIFMVVEFLQMWERRARYFEHFWSWLSWVSILLNIAVTTAHHLNADPSHLHIFQAIAVFLMWFRLFYWMMLFDSTSSFIRMFQCIFSDLIPFAKMFIICLFMFACTQATIIQYTSETLTTPVFGVPLVDATVRMYLNALGQADNINFTDNDIPSVLSWIIFLFATVILQIIFLNVIIAIMADTHDKAADKAEANTNKGKISLMNDFVWIINIEKVFKGYTYVYCVREVKSDRGNDEVSERIIQESKSIQKNNKQRIDKMQVDIEKKFQDEMDQLKNLMQLMSRNISKIMGPQNVGWMPTPTTIQQLTTPILNLANTAAVSGLNLANTAAVSGLNLANTAAASGLNLANTAVSGLFKYANLPIAGVSAMQPEYDHEGEDDHTELIGATMVIQNEPLLESRQI